MRGELPKDQHFVNISSIPLPIEGKDFIVVFDAS